MELGIFSKDEGSQLLSTWHIGIQRNYFMILVLLSVSILLATLLTLPRIEITQPDPYFHVKITPMIYWIGFLLTIFFTLKIIFSKDRRGLTYILGLFFIMLLSVYVYDVPKLFYVNPIYTDTYIFVGESAHILLYGHIGFGHANETPGLSLFSSQFSLITGLDNIIVAEIIPLIIPLVLILMVYVLATMFFSKRIALLACLLCISISWFGFFFNRQSFSLILHLFVYYSMFRIFFHKTFSKSWYVVAILSYTALTISHPVSSLLVISTAFVTAILPYLVSLVRRTLHKGEIQFEKQNLVINAMLLGVVFSIIWYSWNSITGVNLNFAIQTIDSTIRSLFGIGNSEQVGALRTSYTSTYLPIVGLRFLEIIFESTVGTILSILVLVKINSNPKKNIILSSWFIGSMSILVFGFFSGWFELLTRPFLHSFPAFSILLASFIISRNRTHVENRHKKKATLKIVKMLALCAMVLFLLFIPLTMYTNAPFMYPPRAYLKEIDYLTRYGNGTIAAIEFGSGFGYYQLINNAFNTHVVDYSDPNEQASARIIGTCYRGYTTDAFNARTPSLTNISKTLEMKIVECPTFAKIYTTDSWHNVYLNQTARPH